MQLFPPSLYKSDYSSGIESILISCWESQLETLLQSVMPRQDATVEQVAKALETYFVYTIMLKAFPNSKIPYFHVI